MRVGCKVPGSFHLARLAEGKVILNYFWDYPHPITSLGIIVFKTLPFVITGGKDVILGNYGPAWRFYRKLFVTALRQYLSDPPLIESRVSTQAEKLVQFMEEQDGKPFDPADCLMHGVADVICGIAFKDGSDTANPDLNKFVKLFSKYVANANDNTAVAILDFFSWARYLPIKAYDRALQPFFEMHDIIRKLLRERKRNFDPAEPVADFRSGLLRAKHDLEGECEGDETERAALLSEDHFVVSIGDMVIAGYETTSTTLKWVIAFLVNFPRYQEDIQRQLDEAVGRRVPSLNDRPNLPLVQATIIESLRVANVSPLTLPHMTLTDTTLCGYRVPKDTIVFANT